MNTDRPICVLVGALGGQGGGVLAEWLVEAARLAGLPAQATSIPGVAQRTGATTYYFEVFPERNPAGDPVFCLFPSMGDVDLVAALEPTEAGRALERGYVTDKTTVVTSTTRVYSTAEKSIAGDGVIASSPIMESLARAAKTVIQIDPANPFGRDVNAVLFGAVIGSGVLPLTEEQGRAAIEARGLAAADNLAGFQSGLEAAERLSENSPPRRQDTKKHQGDLEKLGALETWWFPQRSSQTGLEEELRSIPDSLRPLIGHALARLVDYQDRAYARRYLDRLQPILDADDAAHDFRLTAQVARRLAAWMSAEDVIRVAQLKTRPGRLARIRREVSARPGEPVEVVDFLSPSRAEVLGMVPLFIARRFSDRRLTPLRHAPGALRRVAPTHAPSPPSRTAHPADAEPALSVVKGRLRGVVGAVSNRQPEVSGSRARGLALAWPTSSPWGYAALKLLAALKPIRPRTSAFAHEQQAIETWLDAVKRAAQVDYDLACRVAEVAVWARGYGQVRSRGLARLAALFADWPHRLAEDVEAVRKAVADSLHAARHSPD